MTENLTIKTMGKYAYREALVVKAMKYDGTKESAGALKQELFMNRQHRLWVDVPEDHDRRHEFASHAHELILREFDTDNFVVSVYPGQWVVLDGQRVMTMWDDKFRMMFVEMQSPRETVSQVPGPIRFERAGI